METGQGLSVKQSYLFFEVSMNLGTAAADIGPTRRISGRIPVRTLAFTILRMAIALAAGQARAQTYGPGAYENVPKFIALAFSCLFIFSMPAKANDADSFNAMVALANKGVAEAQYHAGMMYNNGIGTQKDPKQAFEWFQKSAASNDPLGAYKLGCYYAGQFAGVVTPDANEALKYKLVSAKAGYALAQHDVAVLYARQENSEEAVKWWKAAGDQGLPDALYSLSGSYFQGKGAPKDLSLAYAYFKLSTVAPKNKVNAMATILSKPELENAEKLVSEWKPQPTALTLKAKRGVSAAEELLKTTKN